jgi:O-antigen/teichoic acid export membrane protein
MLKKAFYTLSTDIVVFVLSLINSIIINRALGPKLLGKFFLVTTSAALIVNIVSMGINVSNSTLVAKDRSKINALFTQSILISLIIGVTIIIVFSIGTNIFSEVLLKGVEPELILLALLAVPVLLYFAYWSAIMVGLEEISFLNRYNLFTNVLSLFISVIVLVVLKLGIKELLYASLINNSFLSFFCGFIIFKKNGGIRFVLDLKIIKESFILGIKTHIGNIAHFIFHRIDYFLVNYLLGAKAVGYYGLATSMAERIWMIISPLYTVTFAKITSSSFKESKELVARILRSTIFLLILLAVAMGTIGHWLIKFIYGEEFLPAYLPMSLLLPGVIFFGASWFLGLFFIGQMKKPETTSIIAWIGLAISLPLYFWLIKMMGIAGAAIASSVTYIFIFSATLSQFIKISKLPLSDTLFIKKKEIHEIFSEAYRFLFMKRNEFVMKKE